MSRKFQLNKQEVEDLAIRRYKTTIYSGVVTCLVILTVFVIILMINQKDSIVVIKVATALAFLLILPSFLIVWASIYLTTIKNLKYLVDEVEIGDGAIIIDKQAYLYDKIKQIKATAPSYNVIHRMMEITDEDNKTAKFLIGFGNIKTESSDLYKEICHALKAEFKNTPEKFIYNL